MPRNGTGTYTPPASTWNPGVNGVTATTADFNALLTDVAAAITQSVSADGQTPMTGALPMGNNKVTGMALGTANTDGASLANLQAIGGQAGSAAYRNRTRNGRFNVNQRAVSGTVTLAAGAYGHDGWKAGASGCTYTFSTTAGLTTINISAGSLLEVIEDKDIDGGTYCLSWSGTATGRLNNTGSYAASPITGALTGGASAYVEFTAGTLTLVQLELGTVATPFQSKPYAVEQTICQRYYQTSYENEKPGAVSSSGNRLVTLNFAATTPGLFFSKSFETRMRVAPTITIYNPATGATGSMRNETLGTDLAAVTFGTPGPGGFSVLNNAASSATTNIYSIHYAATADL